MHVVFLGVSFFLSMVTSAYIIAGAIEDSVHIRLDSWTMEVFACEAVGNRWSFDVGPHGGCVDD